MVGYRLSAAIVLLLLLAPQAGAFASAVQPVDLAYETKSAPMAIAAGGLVANGVLQDVVVAANLTETRLMDIPSLTVSEGSEEDGFQNDTYSDVTLVIHTGSITWRLAEGESLDVNLDTDYGLLMGLPQMPFGDEESETSGGFLLAAPALQGTWLWKGDLATLFILDSTVSLIENGQPISGWDHREVNKAKANSGSRPQGGVHFEPTGAFETILAASAIIAGVGSDADFTVSISESPVDRFDDAIDAAAALTQALGQNSEDPFANPAFDAIRGFSGLLNGGLLLLNQPGQESTPARSALVGGVPVEPGAFALMRSESLTFSWAGDESRVQGNAKMVVTQQGFAVTEPASIGFVPILVLVFWLAAAGAMVAFIVKRPPKGVEGIIPRLSGVAASAIAFLVVFWLWDRSFAQAFGTSFLTLLSEGGSPQQMLMVLGLETAPWGLTALAFALPTRIALGIGLRYLGRGKSLKGYATAGGLFALGILGPVYALWLMNVVILLGQKLL